MRKEKTTTKDCAVVVDSQPEGAYMHHPIVDHKNVEVLVEDYDLDHDEQGEDQQLLNNDYLSLALGSPQNQKPCPRAYSISAKSQNNHPQQIGLTMSIAEKPKSQEVPLKTTVNQAGVPYQMITESETAMQKDGEGMVWWQEGGNASNQAVCPSNQLNSNNLAYNINNDFSEQAQGHMNTFANTKFGSTAALNKIEQQQK